MPSNGRMAQNEDPDSARPGNQPPGLGHEEGSGEGHGQRDQRRQRRPAPGTVSVVLHGLWVGLKSMTPVTRTVSMSMVGMTISLAGMAKR